mgnify:FL=1|tara:strand:+ start:2814 stop:2984 length:171 start_codon:yes stop_codon:yes gene_type:complete
MHIKIFKVAKNNGTPKAFTVKVNGKKFPPGYSNWYFVDSPNVAKKLALLDYLDTKK